MELRGKHKRILDRILAPRIPSDIRWPDFVALVEHLGGEVKTRTGATRVAELNGVRIAFHEPHGSSGGAIKPGMLRRIRGFLIKAGVDSQ